MNKEEFVNEMIAIIFEKHGPEISMAAQSEPMPWKQEQIRSALYEFRRMESAAEDFASIP